ncbi:MAG: aminoacyl-tRNA deacylase [Planctomycetota bacterium]|nr:MAG: aminoacyl-tRNA deacylase [Planctomycetota bacterium]
MGTPHIPATPAIRVLRAHSVEFVAREYAYVEKGGTAASSSALGVDEHAVVKTLVFETDAREPLLVLMHGDRQVSAKGLARLIGVRSVEPCRPEVARKHTGYEFGGTSPFGTRRALPVYLERSVLELERVWINGGRRGLLVELASRDLLRVLAPTLVDVAIAG